MSDICAQMPVYVCHKKVWALKIKAATREKNDGPDTMLLEFEGNWAPRRMTPEWTGRNGHQVEPGGYMVQYADGYLSYSPGAAFEEGYTLVAG